VAQHPAERRNLYSFLAARRFENVRSQLKQYARSLDVPPVDFDPEAARDRLLGTLTAAAGEAIRHVREAGAGRFLRWPPFADALRAAGVDPAQWDVVAFATNVINHDRPVPKAIDGSGLEGWLDRTAAFAPRRLSVVSPR